MCDAMLTLIVADEGGYLRPHLETGHGTECKSREVLCCVSLHLFLQIDNIMTSTVGCSVLLC